MSLLIGYILIQISNKNFRQGMYFTNSRKTSSKITAARIFQAPKLQDHIELTATHTAH